MRAAQSLRLSDRWPADKFPRHLPEATTRLRTRVLQRIGPDGAIREPCRSRILESALAAALLERTGLFPDRRARLVEYLRAARVDADPIASALADCALGNVSSSQTVLVNGFAAAVPSFTERRKRATLQAFFATLGAGAESVDLDACSTDGLHCWAAAQVTSAKVILAAAGDQRRSIHDRDIAILQATQQKPTVWEGNILVHLSVLSALATLPGMSDVVAEGVSKLLVHQRNDGGFPFVTDVDTWCTATAAVALHAAGATSEQLRPLATYLETQQQSDGGWSFTGGAQQTDVDDTSVILQFLQCLDAHAYRDAIRRGLEQLRGLRGDDGGFPTYVAGSPSEACMTAAAIDAFTVDWSGNEPVITGGLGYLAASQHPDGGFDPDWSSSELHTVFRAVLVCTRNYAALPEPARQMRDRALRLVIERQQPDGGYGQQRGEPSDPISTSYALTALSYQRDPMPAAKAVEYLLDHQTDSGAIPSVPDSIGPRGFVFSIPVLADIFALLALGHLAHRIDPAPNVKGTSAV
jgi:squalene-hopene/tetraprenyl-beta-curcumene cyclase